MDERTDTERIDWLAARNLLRPTEIHVYEDFDGDGWYAGIDLMESTHGQTSGEALRTAIDAAMDLSAASGEGTKG